MAFDAGKPVPSTYLVISEGTGPRREARLVVADDSQDVPGSLAVWHTGVPPSPRR
jgi:hypothetical protein